MHSAADVLANSLDPAIGPVTRVETHVSSLIFHDGWVYKVKRPVHFEFVDLSTPERRERICQNELIQNRRFAPDVYDSVIEIRDTEGVVIDHAVKMRRMPADRRLSTLLVSYSEADRDRALAALRDVARIMAVAHASAPRGPLIDDVAAGHNLEFLWLRSVSDMFTYDPLIVDQNLLRVVEWRAMRYLRGRSALFADRIAKGMIVDGHGDLLADDIFCLDDSPRILDCLEFDDQLRYGDVILDIGFLAMDLERLGRPELVASLLDWYAEFSNEHHPASLLHHYVAYRALIRSKVAALRSLEDPEAGAASRKLLRLCEQHLRAAEVVLVLVGGLPGTGKTTMAKELTLELAQSREWATFAADAVRKELAGIGGQAAPAPFGGGIYSAAHTEATYRELLRRASFALSRGQSVILDASFVDQRWRSDATQLASESHSTLVALRCQAPSSITEQRMRARIRDVENLSDANAEIAAKMSAVEDPWSSAVNLDTTTTLARSVSQARSAIDIAVRG